MTSKREVIDGTNGFLGGVRQLNKTRDVISGHGVEPFCGWGVAADRRPAHLGSVPVNRHSNVANRSDHPVHVDAVDELLVPHSVIITAEPANARPTT